MEESKRKFERAQCEIDSSFKSLEQSSRPVSETVVHDISERGIRFRSGDFIPVNHRLLFKINIPNHKTSEALARPAWIREIPSINQYDVGAEFISLSEENREIIRFFASERMTKQ